MAERIIRTIFFYRRYFLDFYATLQPAVQRKFDWTLQLVATVDRVPGKFLKHLEGTDGLYEIRVEVGSEYLPRLQLFRQRATRYSGQWFSKEKPKDA